MSSHEPRARERNKTSVWGRKMFMFRGGDHPVVHPKPAPPPNQIMIPFTTPSCMELASSHSYVHDSSHKFSAKSSMRNPLTSMPTIFNDFHEPRILGPTLRVLLGPLRTGGRGTRR